jgi:hypothetical protein
LYRLNDDFALYEVYSPQILLSVLFQRLYLMYFRISILHLVRVKCPYMNICLFPLTAISVHILVMSSMDDEDIPTPTQSCLKNTSMSAADDSLDDGQGLQRHVFSLQSLKGHLDINKCVQIREKQM